MDASSNGIERLQNHASAPTKLPRHYQLSTQAVHADDMLNQTSDVAPALHVSTTFRYDDDPEKLVPCRDLQGHIPTDSHVYSRETAPISTRLEAILESLLHAPSITYSSGLAALHAAYVLLNPRIVSIGGGYHGSHGVLSLHTKLTGAKVLPLDCSEEEFSSGDVIHLETPVNPTGEAFEIERYAKKAHSRGAFLLVDSTFGPPGLQDPFLWGADIVMHSGTKYLGGHSDMLCGILASKNEKWIEELREERTYLGSIAGSLESWLGVRSVRTLALRVQRQSENAEKIVEWIDGILTDKIDAGSGSDLKRCVASVHHASLQYKDNDWLRKQMPNGSGPVFALMMKSEGLARRLPSKTQLFHHATSLGGVESLMEWRAMSDRTVDRRLVRLSIGVEFEADLREDLANAFSDLASEVGRHEDGTTTAT